MTKTTPRKKRTDRLHIVYELVVGGQNYIGVTAKTASTINKSVMDRFNKHWYRAQTEGKDWLLCSALRAVEDRSQVSVYIYQVIRGKSAAHKREVEIRRLVGATLNSDCRGD